MSLFLRSVLLFCAIIGLGWNTAAMARRAALIIGNSAYTTTSALPNPGNDARLIAEAARKAKFDVILVHDLGKDAFDKALRDFRAQADGAEVALIYFAGHGIEAGGTNWLLPVDAKLTESRDLRFEAIELDGLLETIGNAQRRVVILDACRNNPFGSNWSSGTRSLQRGLAASEVEGVLVIYAASGGQVATDGTDGNSPFAAAVAKRMLEPGLLLQMLGPKVTDDVLAITGGVQRPWTNSGMGGQEYFLVPAETPKPAATPEAAGASGGTAEAYAWRYADKANTVEDYNEYLRKFPDGAFEMDAKSRIAALGGVVQPPVAVVSDPARQDVQTAQSATPSLVAASVPVAEAASAPTAAVIVLPPPVAIAPNPAGYVPSATASTPPPSSAVTLPQGIKLSDLAPLPTIPIAPKLAQGGYPECRESYNAIADTIGRIYEINRCLSLLNGYYTNVLNTYRATMAQHQQAVSRLYTEQVGGSGKYTPESQAQFYRDVMAEHAAAAPDGRYLVEHRAAETRYQADRTYLEDRYCFSTGQCGGYPPPRPATTTSTKK
jgi:uncharacterized caspase-like protein